ncbi:MAG TPA: hypothetical protein VJJ72_02320 [Candidatus Paceibacterota bacterium]
MNNKAIFWTVGIIAILLIAWLFWPNKNNGDLMPGETETPTASPSQAISPSAVASPTGSPSPTVLPDGTMSLSGELKVSDNESKGNLLLVTSDSKIYLRTSRDFSPLIDKQVEVIILGTIESFSLVTIREK